jgi:hypothetical protein
MQYLCKRRLLQTPIGQLATTGVLRLVTQKHARQRTQHQFHIICTHTKAQAHVTEFQSTCYIVVAGGHTAHQYITAATWVFG